MNIRWRATQGGILLGSFVWALLAWNPLLSFMLGWCAAALCAVIEVGLTERDKGAF